MRVTIKDLEGAVARINRMTGSPPDPYVRDLLASKHVAQIGNYHLSWQNGGVALHRMVSESGGIRDVLGRGHISKPALYEAIHAFIRGMEETKS